jgi:membrane protease YdiL (CAAX protease family)
MTVKVLEISQDVINLSYMTGLRRHAPIGLLAGFTLLLISPGVLIRAGMLSFDLRFHALLAIAGLCLLACALAGFSLSELGLERPSLSRHGIACGAFTALLAGCVYFEASAFAFAHQHPHWVKFAPFYIAVSSPLQEVVCRAIPKLITDRLRMSGRNYILYSAAVFSLMHYGYGDPVLLANTFFAGLVWASAYLLTRNIWPSIISHATVGTLAFALGVA